MKQTPKGHTYSDQLKVILWKNLIVRKRHWFLTLCEAAIPVLLFLLIAYGRSKITSLSKQHIIDVTYNDKYPILYDQHGFNLEETQLFYSPRNEYFADIIHRVQVKFQLINNNIQGFDTEQQLLETYAKSDNFTVLAIIFNSDPGSTHFDYTIRHHKSYFSWQTDKLYENEFTFLPGSGSRYVWEGFLTLQKALDMSFIEKEKEHQAAGDLPDILLHSQEFPYPPYKSDAGLASLFIHYMPLMTLFSFMFVCPAVLKRVVEEKYTGIKELMKMVGMKSWMLWLGWFIYSIIPMILSVLVIVLILKVDLFNASYPAIEYTDATILFVFLLLYCVAATVNCFFLSSLFYKPTLATLVAILVWIFSYFVPKYLIDGSNNVSFSMNVLLMLLPNMALHYGYAAISQYEIREIGLQWWNLGTPGGNGANEISMLHVFLMLIFDSALYMLLAVYVDAINPGKYGVPKSIFFPFKPVGSLLKSYFPNFVKESCSVDPENRSESVHLQGTEKASLPKGIELINLTKRYGDRTVVKELSLDFYKDRITVLLGHNGAGKTTTMGMITGMIRTSSGSILMNGKNVENTSEGRRSLGLCPQHNLFFPDLTVAEHLQFFAMLKGRSCAEAETEIAELLAALQLEEKKDVLAHTLSGGMKRKLCLGMAVIGGSKILILDEPSSGMDPQSRRHMWDLLLRWRNERTILITTHFMEEADALGDWIAIMNEGGLCCYGTPMHLKKKYGTGSNLLLRLEHVDDDVDRAAKLIEEDIRDFVPEVKCQGVNGNEVRFLLPSKGNFVTMFEHLESNKRELNIGNISFTNTTLEDVFLRNAKDYDTKLNAEDHTETDEFADNTSTVASTRTHTFTESVILTSKALFYKKAVFLYRNRMTYVLPAFIAVCFLLLSIYLGQGASQYSDNSGPPLKLSLSTYGRTAVFLNTSDHPDLIKLSGFYKHAVGQTKSDLNVVKDVSEEIVKRGVANLPFYRRHMVAAAELSFDRYLGMPLMQGVVLYNNLAKHSAPISLNLITNSIAKLVLGDQYSISIANHPLGFVNTQRPPEELSEVQIGLLWLMIVPLGFLFFMGSFIYFPYMEISTNFTQIQFMCGLRPSFYWFTTYLFDFGVWLVFSVVMATVVMVWAPFRGCQEFGAILAISALYGLAALPCAYLFGRKKSFSGAYSVFSITCIIFGVVLTLVVSVLEESGDLWYIDLSRGLRAVFYILIPQFGLTYSGLTFSRKAVNNYNFAHMDQLKKLSVCSREERSPCCHDGSAQACRDFRGYSSVLMPQMLLMLVAALLYFTVNFAWDSYGRKKFFNACHNWFDSLLRRNQYNVSMCDNGNFPYDKSKNQNTLRVENLKKWYANRLVVDKVSLDLKKGECMGILGVNGAGKTTTFRMLTREEVKDNGMIRIDGVSVDDHKYLRKLGYCPQNDALNHSLTGRDILRTMAMLRQIDDDTVVDKFLNIFDLKGIADIPCSQYSGGNKRKLSFAVAMIGFPQFVLLDEPTNGVDPISRRKFWNLIKSVRQKHTSFILTSHSMAECEAVCNNVKIMKKGSIKKEGTISQLKNSMAGYSVMLKLYNSRGKDDDHLEDVDTVDGPSVDDHDKCHGPVKTLDDLKGALKRKYSKGKIRDEHSGLLHFYINADHQESWSELFKQFDDLKREYADLIEDYSISEASLEDVFLSVAKPDDEQELTDLNLV